MPQNRKRKREQYGNTDAELMERAIKMIQHGQSIRETAHDVGIPKSTLQRYASNARKFGLGNIRKTPYWHNARVFNEGEENELEEYLLTTAKHCHGLTIISTKELAYQYAKKNRKSYPTSWDSNQRAGDDWFYGFMSRHPQLSVRKPEATSLSRATSFNRKNIADFFKNLENVMLRHEFQPMSIYNCDETGLLTVHKPPNVIADKKAKQVGQIASAERGTLVTMMGAMNAQGNSIPPFLVFPRVNFKDHMLKNAPPGTAGVAYKTGWMTSANFLVWMEHFIKHAQCSKDNPVLLLMDNHESHITIDSIDKAKANGIVLLTFPPHCSHRLQPLDRTVYGPLKKYYNAACNSWMLSNPGKTMTIYDIAGVLGESFPRAFCPANIISGFRATGIYPFDSNVFGDEEFMSSFVTDRPEPEQTSDHEQDTTAGASTDGLQIPVRHPDQEPPIPLIQPDSEPGTSTSQGESEHFSPEQVRPYSKAGARKQNRCNRKKGRTSILTDTPEKVAREREAKERNERRQRGAQPRRKDDSSETEIESEEATSDLVEDSEQSDMSFQHLNVKIDDYVLVKLATKKVVRHYVCLVLTDPDKDDAVEIKFFSRMLTKSQSVFCNPDKEDIAEVDVDDIVRKLTPQKVVGGTKRTSEQLIFDCDFSDYYRLC